MSVVFGSEAMFQNTAAAAGVVFLDPVFLRFFTASVHLLLLAVLFDRWVFKRGESGFRRASIAHCELTSFSSLGLSLFNFTLWVVNVFYWSDESIILTSVDLAVKAVAWLALYLFLKKTHSILNSVVLRIWWGLFLSVSCYCLAVDFLRFERGRYPSALFWVSDTVSLVMGLVLCCIRFLGKDGGCGSSLEEPFLNDSVARSRRGCETVTPYSKAGVFSLFTFSWMSPLISLGYNTTLDLEDVPQLDIHDSVRGAFPVFSSKLKVNRGESHRVTAGMLMKGLIFTTWREITVSAVYAFVFTLASYVGPYLIDNFVQYMNGCRTFKNEGFVIVSAFVVAKLFESLAQRHWSFKVQQAGNRCRAALVAKIYNKGLNLSCQSKQGQTTGEIINLMSVDAERIGDFGNHLHDPWMVILQVFLALGILYKDVGIATVAGLFATILVMLANVPLGKLQKKFQDKLMKSKDERMKSTTEVLRNMKILKLQAWEMKFLSKILHLRNVETGWLKKYLYTGAGSTFVFWGAPTFVCVVTFVTCLLLGIPLESGKMLSALATFGILQEAIYSLPDTISMFIQMKVSLERIALFLSLDDLPSDVVQKLPVSSLDTSVEVINGYFSWDVTSPNPTLKDINFRVSRGMKVAICGTVGSGKSSLLSCILGEMTKLCGVVRISGAKAYVAQSAWIQSGNIEDNILFGKEMDWQRYNRVLEACSLKKDFEILSFGDQTVIGERGINFSGGQKQRIQIARALYQDADIYLFDDPFSAVDAHTGTHLFNECILGLLESKTVIYVTHQVDFLPAADLIWVMKDGTIKQAGKYNDILKSGGDFMELVGAHEVALSAIDSVNGGERSSGNAKPDVKKQEPQKDRTDRVHSNEEKKAQLVQEEERVKGTVGLSVYWNYIRTACGGYLALFALLSQIVFQILQIGSNYWMAWATPVSKDVRPRATGPTLILVYVAFSVGSSLCILVRALLVVILGLKTANKLFNKMHICIFRSPMSFFDSTPTGRILNRASTDQSTMDLDTASVIALFLLSIVQLLGIIAVMSQVAWQVFLVFFPVATICICLQRYYIASARELARLCGVRKAPVIQHFSETLSGSSTIRCFEQEHRFLDLIMKLVDGYSRPKFTTAAALEWLCLRLDMMSLFTFAFLLLWLISIPEGTIHPSIAGLAVTYALNLNILQVWIVRNLCQMENRIISVERVLQYTSIPSEPPLVVAANRPHSLWPLHGEVNIQNLQVRYAPLMPLVLRGLTCTFFGGKRTGIVGRTGSGKSTLIQTLFRIVDPTTGQIMIDGVDITSIGLHDLRSKLSIIPQDPTMFEGTVRSNLDPLEEYTDAQIWEALDRCQLGDEVRKKAEKLDSPVSENGENWSVGQRQLVCLGRVLLKKSKVLVLDEATASVDTATDNMIQQTLKQHFTDSTVLTIAHRITSVLDSDMVLVLDNGLVEEYDTPEKLLEDNSSSFSKLVAEYGMRSTSSFQNLSDALQ